MADELDFDAIFERATKKKPTPTEAPKPAAPSSPMHRAALVPKLEVVKEPEPEPAAPPPPGTDAAIRSIAEQKAAFDRAYTEASNRVRAEAAREAASQPTTYGLGGARHRMGDREDAELVQRDESHRSDYERFRGRDRGRTGQDVALDLSNAEVAAETARNDRARYISDIASVPGRVVRTLASLSPERNEDDLMAEIRRGGTQAQTPAILRAAAPVTPPSPGFNMTDEYEVGEPVKDERAIMRDAILARPEAFGWTADDVKELDDTDVTNALARAKYRKLAGL